MKRVQVVKSFKKKLICAAIAAALGGSTVSIYAADYEPLANDKADLAVILKSKQQGIDRVIWYARQVLKQEKIEAQRDQLISTDPGDINAAADKVARIDGQLRRFRAYQAEFDRLQTEYRNIMDPKRADPAHPWRYPDGRFLTENAIEELTRYHASLPAGPAKTEIADFLDEYKELFADDVYARVARLHEDAYVGGGMFAFYESMRAPTPPTPPTPPGPGTGSAITPITMNRDFAEVELGPKNQAKNKIGKPPSTDPRPDAAADADLKPTNVLIASDYDLGDVDQRRALATELVKRPSADAAKVTITVDAAGGVITHYGENSELEIQAGSEGDHRLTNVLSQKGIGVTTTDGLPRGHLILSGEKAFESVGLGSPTSRWKSVTITSDKSAKSDDMYTDNLIVKGELTGKPTGAGGDDPQPVKVHTSNGVYVDASGRLVVLGADGLPAKTGDKYTLVDEVDSSGSAVTVDSVSKLKRRIYVDNGDKNVYLQLDNMARDKLSHEEIVVSGKGGEFRIKQEGHDDDHVNTVGKLVVTGKDFVAQGVNTRIKGYAIEFGGEGVTAATQTAESLGDDSTKVEFLTIDLAELKETKGGKATQEQGYVKVHDGREAYLVINAKTDGGQKDGVLKLDNAEGMYVLKDGRVEVVGSTVALSTSFSSKAKDKKEKNLFRDNVLKGSIDGASDYEGQNAFAAFDLDDKCKADAAAKFGLADPNRAVLTELSGGEHVIKKGGVLVLGDNERAGDDRALTTVKAGTTLKFEPSAMVNVADFGDKGRALIEVKSGGKIVASNTQVRAGDVYLTDKHIETAKTEGKVSVSSGLLSALKDADGKVAVAFVKVDDKKQAEGKFTVGKGLFLDVSELKWDKAEKQLSFVTKKAKSMASNLQSYGLSEAEAAVMEAHNKRAAEAVIDTGELTYQEAAKLKATQDALNNNTAKKLAQQNLPQGVASGGYAKTGVAFVNKAHSNIINHLIGHKGIAAAAAGDTFESQGFWGQYIHSDGKQHKKDDVLGYDVKMDGITLGVDAAVNEQLTVGFAFTYAKSDLDVKDVSQSAKGDYYSGTFYAGWTEGPWFMNGMLSYAGGKNDYKANVLGTELKGEGDTQTWGLTFGGGYNLALDDNREWILQPRGEFNFLNAKIDDYKLKSGGVWNQQVKPDDFQVYELGFGARVMGEIDLEQGTLMPEFRLMGYYDFNDKKYEGEITPVGGPSVKFKGNKREQGRGLAGLGLAYAMDNNLTLGLDYDYDFSGKYSAHSIMAKVSYEF